MGGKVHIYRLDVAMWREDKRPQSRNSLSLHLLRLYPNKQIEKRKISCDGAYLTVVCVEFQAACTAPPSPPSPFLSPLSFLAGPQRPDAPAWPLCRSPSWREISDFCELRILSSEGSRSAWTCWDLSTESTQFRWMYRTSYWGTRRVS